MLSYIARRCVLGVFTVVVITVLTFIIIQLPPGDFVSRYIRSLEEQGELHQEGLADALRHTYGLDQPLYVQYWKWVSQFARGQFGYSMLYMRPVKEIVASRLGMTAIITLASIMFTWLAAVPIGIYSAVKQYSVGDYFFTFLGFIGLAIPDFLLALIVMYFAIVHLNVSVGLFSSTEMLMAPWGWAKILDLLKHLWLPAILLGLSGMASLVRITRNNLLDELGQPYVVTARAKGLTETKAIAKYPVRVALNPMVSIIGYTLPRVVSGSIILSIIMGLPTVGPVLYRALIGEDMFLAGTIILLVSVMTVIGTLLSDILLVWMDPRIRMEGR
jgi:peptide/nickel transport system permease protein